MVAAEDAVVAASRLGTAGPSSTGSARVTAENALTRSYTRAVITARRAAAFAVTALIATAGCAAGDPEAGTEEPAAASTTAPAPPEALQTASGRPQETTAASPEARTIEVTVSDGTVSPPPSQVDLAVGDTLRLVVTAQIDGKVHAHGFEVSKPVPAGIPTVIELTGTAPGVYEVEFHDPDLLLLQVAVR